MILDTVVQQKEILKRIHGKELEALSLAYYQAVVLGTQAEQDALALFLEKEGLTIQQVKRSAPFRAYLEALAVTLGDFSGYLTIELRTLQGTNIARGILDAEMLIKVGGADLGLSIVPNSLPADAIAQALRLLDPAGPLMDRIRAIAPVYSAEIGDKILEAVGLGYHPFKTAGAINKLYGYPLNDALRMTRTVQLYSYRRASHSTYNANSEVVTGWYWHAKLDSLTCVSCVAQHGTWHSNEEELNDHYNGRCSPVPELFGQDPVEEKGREWFETLSEEEQKKIMGKGKHALWKEGAISWDQLSIESPDEVYGKMRHEPTLASLKDN